MVSIKIAALLLCVGVSGILATPVVEDFQTVSVRDNSNESHDADALLTMLIERLLAARRPAMCYQCQTPKEEGLPLCEDSYQQEEMIQCSRGCMAKETINDIHNVKTKSEVRGCADIPGKVNLTVSTKGETPDRDVLILSKTVYCANSRCNNMEVDARDHNNCNEITNYVL